ncbi:hypothetical protein LCGC14_2811450 [marine sediment metagenome]|uniref:MPN domain-containing protein n=1 Tax=marine sediment metagenome TaxID=412755 RepID=A0A0F8YJQ8_9ZZZZ
METKKEYYTKKIKTITLQIREPKATLNAKTANSSRKSFEIAQAIYKNLEPDQEHFSVLFLNSQNKMTGYKTLFSGAMSSSIVDSKIVFRNALLFGATAIILIHNHPSGNSKPSSEDKIITEDIIEIGVVLKLSVLDHIILADGTNDYFSFADEGLIKRYTDNIKILREH